MATCVTDESRVLLFRKDGCVRVRRQAHDKYRLGNKGSARPTVQAGGGGYGITIWGAFHAIGQCDLHVLDGNLNQHKYREIIEQKLLPFARAF